VKTLTIVAFATTFVLAAPALTFAQDNSTNGTGNQDKGSSGWTGGTRNPSDGGDKSKGNLDTKSPETGVSYAEGLNLKGPPRQFPPGRPPE
jgi:hypothetical protein